MNASVTDGTITVGDDSMSVEINVHRLCERMDDDTRQVLAEAITWDAILKQAVRRLTNESEVWQGGDDMLAAEVLTKMEEHVVSGIRWSVLKELWDLGRNASSHTHIYWRMWHDEKHSAFFRKWLTEQGIESNYTTEVPTVEALADRVKAALKKMCPAVTTP